MGGYRIWKRVSLHHPLATDSRTTGESTEMKTFVCEPIAETIKWEQPVYKLVEERPQPGKQFENGFGHSLVTERVKEREQKG